MVARQTPLTSLEQFDGLTRRLVILARIKHAYYTVKCGNLLSPFSLPKSTWLLEGSEESPSRRLAELCELHGLDQTARAREKGIH